MPKRNRASEAVRHRAAEEMTSALQAVYAAHAGIIAAWENRTVTSLEAYELLHTVDVRAAAALCGVLEALGVEQPA